MEEETSARLRGEAGDSLVPGAIVDFIKYAENGMSAGVFQNMHDGQPDAAKRFC